MEREPGARRWLTFELRGRSRDGVWPARRMMTLAGARAKRHAGGGPWLERRVRRRRLSASRGLQLCASRSEQFSEHGAMTVFFSLAVAAHREVGAMRQRGQKRD
jgi:hypothetical protein